ncbi:MAG: hypothetical protein M5U08_12880 [Burkholderiales bacterium]|nr:hypothetical protein [Burkholderiales bacterium]
MSSTGNLIALVGLLLLFLLSLRWVFGAPKPRRARRLAAPRSSAERRAPDGR